MRNSDIAAVAARAAAWAGVTAIFLAGVSLVWETESGTPDAELLLAGNFFYVFVFTPLVILELTRVKYLVLLAWIGIVWGVFVTLIGDFPHWGGGTFHMTGEHLVRYVSFQFLYCGLLAFGSLALGVSGIVLLWVALLRRKRRAPDSLASRT